MEALATTALLPQLLGEARRAAPVPLPQHTIAEIAHRHGWTANGAAFVSPDGHCTLRRQPESTVAWTSEHALYGAEGTQWTTRFTGEIPVDLVAEFFAHLSTPAPVQRTIGHLHHLALTSARLTPLPTTALRRPPEPPSRPGPFTGRAR